MKLLFILLVFLWLFFVGEWIYGMVNDKRTKQLYLTSKHTYIGLLGLNTTSICISIVAMLL